MELFNEKLLRAEMVMKDCTVSDLCTAIGIVPATFHGKIKRDGDFTRPEIEGIAKYLGLEDVRPIFFAPKLEETQK